MLFNGVVPTILSHQDHIEGSRNDCCTLKLMIGMMRRCEGARRVKV